MIRESRGDPAVAASYRALERLPGDTLGNAFFRFHRNRGFALPGEPGCIPEELSSLHDLTHILSGYNTDPRGEILSQAFAGGAMEKNGMMVAVIGLLGFHNGVLFDLGSRVPLQKGNLEPHEFMAAWTRGQRSISLMSGWDYKSDWELPVGAVREKFGIADAENIWDQPSGT
jgi:ubiquinone biosynthesis protein Coq4